MSKASLLGLCHDEKMYKEILFPVPDGGSDEGAEMAATYHIIIASSELLRCRHLQKCLYKGIGPK